MKLIEKLEKKGAIALLLFLAEEKQTDWMITELLDRIECSQRALYSAIQRVHQLDLVKEIRRPEHNRRYISLTPRGRKVAEKLITINGMLEDR